MYFNIRRIIPSLSFSLRHIISNFLCFCCRYSPGQGIVYQFEASWGSTSVLSVSFFEVLTNSLIFYNLCGFQFFCSILLYYHSSHYCDDVSTTHCLLLWGLGIFDLILISGQTSCRISPKLADVVNFIISFRKELSFTSEVHFLDLSQRKSTGFVLMYKLNFTWKHKQYEQVSITSLKD